MTKNHSLLCLLALTAGWIAKVALGSVLRPVPNLFLKTRSRFGFSRLGSSVCDGQETSIFVEMLTDHFRKTRVDRVLCIWWGVENHKSDERSNVLDAISP
jgi:hypothetical protein